MENKVIAVLDGMTRLLTEKGWTQGALARDKDGEKTEWHLETACSFCLRGALVVASWQHGMQAQMSARSRLEMALAGTTDPGGVSTPSAAALTGEHADPRGRGGRRVSPTPSSAGFMVRAQGRMAASSSPASWGGARVRVLPDVGRDHSGRRRRMFGPAAARDFRPAR